MTLGAPQNGRTMKIVGIVEDVREEGYGHASQPLVYTCGYLRFWPDSEFLIRTQADPITMVGAIRETIRKQELTRATYAVQTLNDALANTLWENRFRALLVGAFSAIALALAAIGLYGVMAYSVRQRTREIGIRIALGATRRQILGEITRLGGILAGAGIVIGITLANFASRFIVKLLYDAQAFDFTTYFYSTAILFLVAMLACLIPGLRATSIDPTVALRER
jgi:putative ABC transport system permease protein